MYKDVSAVVKEAESRPAVPRRHGLRLGRGAPPVLVPARPQRAGHRVVGLARPLSDGHRRPRLPADLVEQRPRRAASAPVGRRDDGRRPHDPEPLDGRRPVSNRIPTTGAYAATGSFLAQVAPRVRAPATWPCRTCRSSGTTGATLWPTGRRTSRVENEHFTNWPGQRGRFVGADWRWKFDAARWLAARNVPLLAVTYSSATDRAGQTYHRASWLLTWNRRTGASVYVPDELASSHWLPATTQSIGRPSLRPAAQPTAPDPAGSAAGRRGKPDRAGSTGRPTRRIQPRRAPRPRRAAGCDDRRVLDNR